MADNSPRTPARTVTCECGCENFTLEVKTDLFGVENLDLSCVDCGAWRVSAPTSTTVHQKLTVA